jgi:hypothetical protein
MLSVLETPFRLPLKSSSKLRNCRAWVVRVFETIWSVEMRAVMVTKISATLKREELEPDNERGDEECRKRDENEVEG